MRRNRTNRQGRKYSRVIGIVFAILILFFFFVLFAKPRDSRSKRWTVAVIGSPMTMVSWDRSDGRFTILTVPSDIVTEGVSGFGHYTLEALWRLGVIDQKQGGRLVQESLADMVGVPTTWYLGPASEDLPDISDDPLQEVRSMFSWKELPRLVFRAYRSNMPVSNYLAFSYALMTTRPDKFEVFTFKPQDIAAPVELPDGTSEYRVDRDRLDHLIGDTFEDAEVRQEGIPVVVLNTTTVPFLGNRAARMLTRLGVNVVMVGNDEPGVDTCEISGTKQALSSYSSILVSTVLQCTLVERKEEYPVDLVVRIGKKYQEQFITK